jgi:hypothetical protein
MWGKNGSLYTYLATSNAQLEGCVTVRQPAATYLRMLRNSKDVMWSERWRVVLLPLRTKM